MSGAHSSRNAVRVITRKSSRSPCRDIFRKLGIMTLPSLVMYNSVKYILTNRTLPINNTKTSHNLRKKQLPVKACRTLREQRFVVNFGTKVFNKLQMPKKSLAAIKNILLIMSFILLKNFLNRPICFCESSFKHFSCSLTFILIFVFPFFVFF